MKNGLVVECGRVRGLDASCEKVERWVKEVGKRE